MAWAAGLAVAGGLAFVVVGSARSTPPLTLPQAGSPQAPGARPSSSSPTSAPTVVVHVAGAVVRPGILTLPGGSRLADAVAAAGGALPDADVDAVNLAATVGDGERVHVPRRGEPPAAGLTGPSASGASFASTGPLNINLATAAQLEALPGVGPATARAIVEHRTRHGRFRSVDDLLEVRGIGPAKLEALRDQVRA